MPVPGDREKSAAVCFREVDAQTMGFRTRSNVMPTLALPSVTLCAVTSVNVLATVAALEVCLNQVEFAQSLLLTDSDFYSSHPALTVVRIPRIQSANAYSRFMLNDLADHIRSDHCLIVQWDGFILDALQWDPTFLEFDYIGAPWPQFNDCQNVGNGGFSLRSRRLVEACRDARFRRSAAEDVAICRVNRTFLEEEYGLHFADQPTAQRFAFERSTPTGPTFGFHGIFNMINAVGSEKFWELYAGLDDKTTAFFDYRSLMSQIGQGPNPSARRMGLTADRLRHLLRGGKSST